MGSLHSYLVCGPCDLGPSRTTYIHLPHPYNWPSPPDAGRALGGCQCYGQRIYEQSYCVHRRGFAWTAKTSTTLIHKSQQSQWHVGPLPLMNISL